MESQSHTTTFLLIAAFLMVLHRPISAVQTPSPTTNDLDFIRTSCNATLYPDVCFTSLSGYAAAVKANPARLARLAIGISLSRAKSTAAYLAKLSHAAEYGSDHRTVAALHDCVSNVGDAIDEMRGSLKQLRDINRPAVGAAARRSADTFRFQMSNVQTWMSAALTDEDTCTDGFDDAAEGDTKAEVGERIADVKKFTSNALALVNCYANNGAP
ncbi:PREDICTED: 21 kDa protein [Tarenaya hassleriana]|uniref:21 kDa protein n=1 Tax=Tarenaya hassleriana TaxID=28532 RepID=UPI00053C8350|nr:PREDICTED: 21 kDa protein [Tarenaya hassleriana]